MTNSMLRPAVSMARARLGGLIAVVLAVLGGIAMVTATGVLVETGLRSHLPVERLSGAELLVSARQSIPQEEDFAVTLPERVPLPVELADRVASVPGVREATGDVSVDAAIVPSAEPAEPAEESAHGDGDRPIGNDQRVIGAGRLRAHGWGTLDAEPALLTGTPPRSANQVVLDARVASAAEVEPGDRVRLLIHGVARDFRVSGVLDAEARPTDVADTEGAYLHDPTAIRLAGRADGQVDLIAVDLEPGADTERVADEIRDALAGHPAEPRVTSGDARGDVEALSDSAGRGLLIGLSSAMSGTLLLIVGFIIAGVLSVSVANQRRDLALLRVLGATPRQLRRLIASQATVVTLAAAPFGIALGFLLAGRFVDLLVELGMLSARLPVIVGPLPALAAVLLAVLVVQLAARGAAMRTSRLPATEAVAESRSEPRSPAAIRSTIGSALIGLALASTLVPLFTRTEAAFVSAGSSIMLAIIGLALVAPALVRASTIRLRRRLGAGRSGGSAVTWLAISNSHGYALRTAGAVTVLALAVGLTVVQVFSQTTLAAVVAHDVRDGSQVAATVTATGGGLGEEDRRNLAALPEVDAAVPLIGSTVVRRYTEAGKRRAEPHRALAVGHGASRVLDPGVVDGDLSELRSNAIAMDATTAWFAGHGIGDRVPVVLADGREAKPRLVATYDRGLGFGKVMASVDLLTDGRQRGYDAILLAGSDPAAVTAAASGWAEGRPGARADRGGAAAGLDAGAAIGPDRWVNLVVSLALLGYVLLGVGNSLVAATTRRRGEFASLRLIGATPRQIRRMIRRETALLCSIAVGSGLLLSVLPMTFLGIGFVGLPWPQGPWWVIPAITVTVCTLAYLATELPTRRALASPLTGARSAPE